MGRKSRKASPEQERSAAEYYKLNTKAVEELVTASPENSPKVSEKELRKYRSGLQIHLWEWVKMLLIKWWFHGAACFFFLWGLGIAVPSQADQLLILGLATGFITDLMVNNILRYYAKTPGANDRWMMFPKKGFISLPLNVIYGFVLLACVVMTYNVINGAAVSMTGNRDSVPLGVEPLLYGLFMTGWDFLFLGLKRLCGRIISDAKQANKPL